MDIDKEQTASFFLPQQLFLSLKQICHALMDGQFGIEQWP